MNTEQTSQNIFVNGQALKFWSRMTLTVRFHLAAFLNLSMSLVSNSNDSLIIILKSGQCRTALALKIDGITSSEIFIFVPYFKLFTLISKGFYLHKYNKSSYHIKITYISISYLQNIEVCKHKKKHFKSQNLLQLR